MQILFISKDKLLNEMFSTSLRSPFPHRLPRRRHNSSPSTGTRLLTKRAQTALLLRDAKHNNGPNIYFMTEHYRYVSLTCDHLIQRPHIGSQTQGGYLSYFCRLSFLKKFYFLDSCCSEFVLVDKCTYCKSLWMKESAKWYVINSHASHQLAAFSCFSLHFIKYLLSAFKTYQDMRWKYIK